MQARNGRLVTIRRFGWTGALGVFWTAAPAISGTMLLVYLGAVSEWLLHHPGIGLALYVVVFVFAAGFGLLPTYAQSVVGGWVFGLWLGLPAALIGFTGGAVIGYAVARHVAKHRIEEVIERHPKAHAIRAALIGRGFWRTVMIVAMLRAPINSPFALTNLVMAATGVPYSAFVLGTTIGMIPRTLAAVALAAAAAQTGAKDIQAFVGETGVWLLIGGIVAMFLVLAIIGAIAKQALARMNAGREPQKAEIEQPVVSS